MLVGRHDLRRRAVHQGVLEVLEMLPRLRRQEHVVLVVVPSAVTRCMLHALKAGEVVALDFSGCSGSALEWRCFVACLFVVSSCWLIVSKSVLLTRSLCLSR